MVENEIRCCLDNLDEWMQPDKKSTNLLNIPASSYTINEPYGVALILGAWNYPVMLSLQPLVGCIAAGNCAVIKVMMPRLSTPPSLLYSPSRTRFQTSVCGKPLTKPMSSPKPVWAQVSYTLPYDDRQCMASLYLEIVGGGYHLRLKLRCLRCPIICTTPTLPLIKVLANALG